jgi:hypothetical protein
MTILQEPIETRLFTDPVFTADPRRGLALLRSFRQSMR